MQQSLTSGNPSEKIVKFAIPVLLGNLLQLSYSIADTRIVGSCLGDDALAAVGATTVLSSLYMGFFMGMANGFAIITAKHFGAGDQRKVRCSFEAALLLGLVVSVMLITVSLLFLPLILTFLRVPDQLLPQAGAYIRIILCGLVVTMIYDVLLASARAIGDSLTPLLILIVSVCLNIFGDLLMLAVFHTAVWGAAAATVGAQIIAMAVCAIYLMKRHKILRPVSRDMRQITASMIKEMFLTGCSMGLMNSLINIGSMILQTSINSLSNSYIVAQTAARKITEVMMSVFVAFGQTMATYCSQNFGAGRYDRIRQGIRVGCQITCSWCAVVLLIIYPFAERLVSAITGSNDRIMIEAASQYLRLDSILYVLVAVIFILRNSQQGMGDRVTPLISSGIEMGGKIILTYTLVPVLGYFGVILVEPIVWIVMIIPLIVRMKTIWPK